MDKLLAERVERYGSELGEPFHYMYNHWCEVWLLYKQYVTLFGTNEKRIQLLNTAAPTLFSNVEKYFWEAIVLGLCRINDPVKSMGNRNLSLRSLADYIDDSEIRQSVVEAAEFAAEKSKNLISRRNKRLAHLDFNIATKRATLHDGISRRDLKETILASFKPLRVISMQIADVDIRPFVVDRKDDTSLLINLFIASEKAEEFDRETLQTAIKNGKLHKPYPDWLFDENFEKWMNVEV